MSKQYTFDGDIVSDLHKDAYGFRPSQGWWESWKTMSDDEKQGEWDNLIFAMNCSMEYEREQEARATKEFEDLVIRTIQTGAKTREDAIRWIMDASDCDGDWEYLCYKHGLPYGYFKKAA